MLSLVVLVLACADPPSLAAALTAAMRIESRIERRRVTLEIAHRRDATADALRAAALETLVRAPVDPGSHTERASIWAGGRAEDVELATYVPRGYDATKPAPLILAFHGTGGSGNGLDAMWRKTADAIGAIVVAPGEAGANEGYAFSAREREAALGALRWAQLRYRIDPERIAATGISRGGHLAWDLALRKPDRFAALAPMIGCPRFQLVRGENNLRLLENVVELPIRDLQGSKDDPGVLRNLRQAFARLEALHARDAKLVEFPELGHSFEMDAVDWTELFGRARRSTRPERVVLASADLDDARSHWLEITAFDGDVQPNPSIDVKSGEWSKLDETGRHVLLQKRIDAATARVEVVRRAIGRYEVRMRGVARLRILLEPGDIVGDQPIEISIGGKAVRKKPRLDAGLAALEIVERIDATFLPIAYVELP